MNIQDTKEVIFITVFLGLISVSISAFLGWSYGANEAQKEFDKYVKLAKDAQVEAEKAQKEAMRLQREAGVIIMRSRE